ELAFYDYKEMIYTPDMEREPPKIQEPYKSVKVTIKYEGGIPKKVRLE
ncbi:MAG: NADH-quinone oxidoreductase subunit I, partial [Pyrobaculum sp.]